MKSLWNPFNKKQEEPFSSKKTETPDMPEGLPDTPEAKGVMAMFYRKWKDPAFLKQMRTLAAYMARDGVNVKDFKAVKEWMDKNKDAIEAGKFNELPASGEKPHTYEKTGPEIGRNDPCTCGSGKKYKKCCGINSEDNS